MKYPIVRVSWVDSATLNGWHRDFKTATSSDVKCCTSGFLLYKSKKRLVVALNVNDQDQRGHMISIPRAAVTAVRVLKKGKS